MGNKVNEKVAKAMLMSSDFYTFAVWMIETDTHATLCYQQLLDDDGYGMTDDEETTVYGLIDVAMNVLVKFQYIGRDWERLKAMRREEERKLRR